MRVVQSAGAKGSLKWIQRAVAEQWPSMDDPILRSISVASKIEWLSPVQADEFAEYRDAAFLQRLGLNDLAPDLADFWPRRGPQWDALGRTDTGEVLLVEAKAHIDEFCTPPTSAGEISRGMIEARLAEVAADLGVATERPWADPFYQLANRIAHLWFLRRHGVPAFLVLVGFLGDREMRGPDHAETWRAAFRVACHSLGLPAKHKLSRFILHVHPVVPA